MLSLLVYGNKLTDYYRCIGIKILNSVFLGNEVGNNLEVTNWIHEFLQSIDD